MESNIKPQQTVGMIQTNEEIGAEATSLLHAWLWQPNLIVFISSGCIMILELVAGRIVAPYVGVSLYTWTSIIGVVLAGISLGNYLGGWLADRWASLRFLGGIFLLSGLTSLGILLVDRVGRVTPGHWSIVIEILVLTTLLFFIPCLLLGTVSPVVAKLAVRDLTKTGLTVGKIYAAGTAGSIVGTFATGFVLISWFGTHTIVWGVAVILIGLGLLLAFGQQKRPLVVALLLVGGATVLALNQGWLRGPCLRETNYFCIKIKEQEREGGTVRVLILDRLVHSHSSLDDPTKLVYGYEKMYAEVTAYQVEQKDRLSALFIGGGGYTFPRYIEAVYPDSRIDVIEIDPGVTQAAYDFLGLSREAGIKTFNQDARLYLEDQPTQQYDLIMGDAFNDFSVPYHLTTKEFNDRVQAWLAEDGFYVINMIDGGRSDFLRAYIHTLRQTFTHVYVAPTSDSWQISPRTTFVLIAGDTPLDVAAFEAIEAGDSEALLARQVFNQAEVDELLANGYVVILTDQYAPVDQMLAPVTRGETLPE